MNSVFKSKIGLEIFIPVFVILGVVTALMAFKEIYVGIAICGVIDIFIMFIVVTTDYTIVDREKLLVRCGLFRSEIRIDTIHSITATNELSNAPALSIDRLQIRHASGAVLVSPNEKQKFVDELLRINPSIRIL